MKPIENSIVLGCGGWHIGVGFVTIKNVLLGDDAFDLGTMTKQAVLLLGGGGQVGTALRRRSWPGDVDLVAPPRTALDLSDEAAISSIVASRPWSCVINAAAYTSVDAAESETGAAWRLNAQAPGYLAAVTARSAIPLLHLSSDFVFGGIASAAAHRPTDECSPLNVYGASKAAGERAIRSMNQRHIILRTSWVVSPYRANFVKTILRLAVNQPLLKVVDDQRGRPTSAIDLAAVVQSAALGLMRTPDSPIGTYHFANSGETTWLEIARAVVARARERKLCRTVVDGIGSHEYNSPARRPANSVLCTESLERDFGITPRDWKAALAEILDELLDDTAFNVAHPKMAAGLQDIDTR